MQGATRGDEVAARVGGGVEEAIFGSERILRSVEATGGATGWPGTETSDVVVWTVVVVVVSGGSSRFRTNFAGASITRNEVTATSCAALQPTRKSPLNRSKRTGARIGAINRSFQKSARKNAESQPLMSISPFINSLLHRPRTHRLLRPLPQRNTSADRYPAR